MYAGSRYPASSGRVARDERLEPATGFLRLAHAHRRPVGADLGPAGAELGGVEAHRDDRVRAFRLRLADHPLHHLLPAVGERLRHPPQLTADDRLQAGTDL